MSAHRKAISIAIAVIMIFSGLPVHFTDSGGFTQAYAAEEVVFSDDEAVAADKAWLAGQMEDQIGGWVTSNLTLPINGPADSSISWSSDDTGLIDDKGKVSRPIFSGTYYSDAELTATITKNASMATAVFVASVVSLPPGQAVNIGIQYISIDMPDEYKNILSNFLKLNGTAEIDCNTYMSDYSLFSINNNNEGPGSVFTRNKIQLSDDLSFSTYFLFDIFSSDSGKSDEGFTFTLQADSENALGTDPPGSLGVPSGGPSLSIEFDTKRDSEALYEYQGEDTEHHIAVYTNGDYQNPIAVAPAPEYLVSQSHKVWVQYDGIEKNIKIYNVPSYIGDPDEPVISVQLDLSEIFKTSAGKTICDVYAGFTGHSSASYNNIHSRIFNWIFKNDPFPIEYKLPPIPASDLYTDASSVTISSETIDSEGEFTSIVSVTVSDTLGNPVSGVPVTLKTDFGVLDSSSAITDVKGCVNATLTSPTSGTALVRATAQGGAYAEAEAFLIVTDEAKLNKDYDELTADRLLNGNTSLNFVRWDLSLPTVGENGSTITWSSSDINYLKPTTGTEIPTTRLSSDTEYSNPTTGTVTRPTVEEGDQTVTLIALLTNGTATGEKKFTATIKIPDADMVALDSAWLADTLILNGNTSWNQVISTLLVPDTGENGSNIQWTSSNEDIIAIDGTVNRPIYTADSAEVTVAAIISMGEEIATKTFLATVIPLDATESDRMWEAYHDLEETDLLNGNADSLNIIGDLTLPETGLHESIISWASSDVSVIGQTGTVTRPAFLDGDTRVTLTATITIGTESATKLFTFTVKESEPTDQEAVDETVEWLTVDEIKGTNLSLDQVTANLLLHTTGSYSTEIQWTSDNPLVIETNGTVICPSFTQGNTVVKLTAVIKRGVSSITKEFDVTVLTLNSTDEEAVLKAWDLLTYEKILGENEDAKQVETSLMLSFTGEEGTTINWSSTPEGYISTTPGTIGQLSPPSFTTGDVAVTLKAIIVRGDKSKEKEFNVIVKAMSLTDEEAVTLDSNSLKIWD
ncbi:MAG: immunoglobulin-like domain-containing protein, partial [Anaerovoracaceae bacterium]